MSAGDIPVAGTYVPGGSGFGIIYAKDQVGGWAAEANEAAIGALAAGRLVVNGTWRVSLSSGVTYLLTSLTPSGGFANGTWVPQLFNGSGGSFSPGVKTVTVANDTLSGLAARNGYTPVAGDRILVAAQTLDKNNGIYVAASGAWSRSSDASLAGDYVVGKTVFVLSGTSAGFLYGVTVAPTTLGTDPIDFASNSSGGAVTDWAHPGSIGSATPNSGVFTSIRFAPGNNAAGFGMSTTSFVSDADIVIADAFNRYGYLQINGSANTTPNRKVGVGFPDSGSFWMVFNNSVSPIAISLWDAGDLYFGSTVSIPAGQRMLLVTDGTNGVLPFQAKDALLVSTVQVANFTAISGLEFKVDPSGGSFTVQLPTPGSENETIDFWVMGNCDDTHTVTLSANGSGITVRDPFRQTDGATAVINRVGHVRIKYLTNGSLKTWAVQ